VDHGRLRPDASRGPSGAVDGLGGDDPGNRAQLNVSPNTVKTHLRKVFAKTGVGRQAELARLIASLDLLRTRY